MVRGVGCPRVGEEQVDGHPVQQPVEVGLAPGVAAEQAMVAEEPEVTGLRDRLVDVVRVGQPILRLGGCKGREHRRERVGADGDLSEDLPQLGLVGGGHRRERIEAGQHEPLLVGGEVDVEDGDRWLLPADRKVDPEVAVDDVTGALRASRP